MATTDQGSILTETYASAQLEVERRLEDVMSAARRQAVDELESYHAFGPKFTKFDDFEPLERQDGTATRQLERDAILSVQQFDPRLLDLKIDVFGSVAVTTFVMRYAVVDDAGEHHSFRARATMVLVKAEREWLIVHEHFSPFVANSQRPGSSIRQPDVAVAAPSGSQGEEDS